MKVPSAVRCHAADKHALRVLAKSSTALNAALCVAIALSAAKEFP
jgi:hypothetical protein